MIQNLVKHNLLSFDFLDKPDLETDVRKANSIDLTMPDTKTGVKCMEWEKEDRKGGWSERNWYHKDV